MRKNALIFTLAIFLPAVVLGWLALQSARQQHVLMQNQAAQLRQQEADNVATQLDLAIRVEHENFVRAVERMSPPPADGQRFDALLRRHWVPRGVGFIVSGQEVLTPLTVNSRAREFLENNAAFLRGSVAAEVYRAEQTGLAEMKESLQFRQQLNVNNSVAADEKINKDADVQREKFSFAKRTVAPLANAEFAKQEDALASTFTRVENSKFSALVEGKANGIIARFVNDRLELLFWTKSEKMPGMIFGVCLLPEDLRGVIEQTLRDAAADGDGTLTAVLDDRAAPFAVSPPRKSPADGRWSRPFVAAEIGEVLPHWEVGIYLLDAGGLARSARLATLTLTAVIALALAAVATGGWLVARDTQRRLALARQQTDFVSNVSHELKTPLTSIRMFAELLQQGRVSEPEKVSRYLRIITAEAERLTRLINNVLDFSRSTRGKKVWRMARLDLREVIASVWEHEEARLREHGFAVAWHSADAPLTVSGDADALAQLLVNLLSNAEKYSPERKEIELHSYAANGEVMVSVLDRGLGVPAGDERKIFEQFYRAHHSLASGIGGSGLGLTLAQQIAKAHGGAITYEPRKGGGSNFTLRLPLTVTL